MNICRLKASFGKLDGNELKFGEGLNLVSALNESGKSTWMEFMRAMLYGIDSSERDSKEGLAGKNKYRPWSGAPMEGTMVVETDGRKILLTRETQLTNAPMKKFSAVYGDTGDEVPGMTGENAGIYLTGVEESVFRQSCCINQKDIKISGNNSELEKRIENIVTSGDESLSFSEAAKKLTDWEHAILFRKKGALADVDEQIKAAERKLEGQRDLNREAARLRNSVRNLKETKNSLEEICRRNREIAEAENVKKRFEAWRERASARAAAENAEKSLKYLKRIPDTEEIKKNIEITRDITSLEGMLVSLKNSQMENADLKDELNAEKNDMSVFAGKSEEEAWNMAKADSETAGAEKIKSKSLLLAVLGAVLLVGGAALLAAVSVYAGVASCVAGIFCVVLFAVQRNRHKINYETIIKKYGVEEQSDILEQAKKYSDICSRLNEAGKHEKGIETEMKECSNSIKEEKNSVSEFLASIGEKEFSDGTLSLLGTLYDAAEQKKKTDTELEQAERLCSVLGEYKGEKIPDVEKMKRPTMAAETAESELHRVSVELEEENRKLSENAGMLKSIGDPAETAAEKEMLEERKAVLEKRLDAVKGAAEILETADSKVRARFSPVLNKKAGEILGKLTGGKYVTLMMDKNFKAQAVPENGAVARDAAYLSQGTVDQIYLAARLAVYETVVPADKKVPIIMDDSLAYFDDERMRKTIDMLLEYSQDRQVIIFSCQEREASYLKSIGAGKVIKI